MDRRTLPPRSLDAEVYAVCQALEAFEERGEENGQNMVFSRWAISRASSDSPGP